MGYVAGIDLGGTSLRARVADESMRTAGDAAMESPTETARAVESAIGEVLKRACGDAAVEPESLTAVGIAGPGRVNEAGVLVAPSNLPGERIGLRAAVAAVHDGPIVHRNDATAGLAGERSMADDPPDDMVYLTLSSGIGAGVCIDGHLLVGRAGGVGEVGHVVLDPDSDRRCGCGGTGHWEGLCGGAHLPDHARELLSATGVPTDLPLDDSDLGAATIFAAAGGDPLADRLIDTVATWNTLGVATLIRAYAPGELVVGGTVALENPTLVVDPIRDRLPARITTGRPAIRTARAGGEAVLRGMVRLARAAARCR